MKILIPMAGRGQRFVDAGYEMSKPLIDVGGKPMIERVVENIGGPSENFIFVISAELNAAGAIPYLRKLVPGCEIVVAWQQTAGAACTALLAREFIDNDEPLLIANADQLVEPRVDVGTLNMGWCDGAIYTFEASNPKWSYAAVDDDGTVWGVAEKQVISKRATCGLYWFCSGNRFVRFAEQMIEKNLRVNNEFYLAPVFNEMIADGGTVQEIEVDKMHGLGTPEDLRAYNNVHFPRDRDGGTVTRVEGA